jgi:hypothetical protein
VLPSALPLFPAVHPMSCLARKSDRTRPIRSKPYRLAHVENISVVPAPISSRVLFDPFRRTAATAPQLLHQRQIRALLRLFRRLELHKSAFKNEGVRRKEPCWYVPCASRRAVSFRLRAYGRICPCSLCSLALSRACVLSPPFARFVRALLGPWPVPVPVPAGCVRGFAYVDSHSWPCVPCARREPPSTGQNPHLTFKEQNFSVLFLPKKGCVGSGERGRRR